MRPPRVGRLTFAPLTPPSTTTRRASNGLPPLGLFSRPSALGPPLSWRGTSMTARALFSLPASGPMLPRAPIPMALARRALWPSLASTYYARASSSRRGFLRGRREAQWGRSFALLAFACLTSGLLAALQRLALPPLSAAVDHSTAKVDRVPAFLAAAPLPGCDTRLP
eukprot:15465964-Alexandrium_andersonii.AAC.1